MVQDPVDRLVVAFREHFGRPPRWIARAPGRVNLIGEHTDYHEGLVLPVAIDRSALVAAGHATGTISRVWSLNLREESAFDAAAPRHDREHSWSNYVRGVSWALAEEGHPLTQVDLALDSDIPLGAGLSSSAALEVASALVLARSSKVVLSGPDLARVAHRAETEFVGVPCGIMDQFISCLAVEDHALLIDCRTQETDLVPLSLDEQGIALVVVDSAVSRQLADSAYRERREQGEAALRGLRALLGREIASLRDVAPTDLEAVGDRLPAPLLRRARHVVTENERVVRSVRALRGGRLEEVGALLAESHRSLRDDYQVSSPELDLLVELAWRTEGVLGARLTGAGFGGCTVNLVQVGAIARFERQVVDEYRQRTGRSARLHLCHAAGGASLQELAE